VDNPQFRRPARHGDRVPRAERRGQVHHDADDPRPGPAGRRGGQDHGQNHRDLRWPLREVGSLLAEGLRRPVIFLSHSRDDSELASALSRELRVEGAESWLNIEQIRFGDSLMEKIQAALDSANAIVIFVSSSLGSMQEGEIGFVLERRLSGAHAL
jgi:TIR domain